MMYNIISKCGTFYEMEFRVCDALNLPFAEEFNVVFSNAVFHWISDHDMLLKNINKRVLVCFWRRMVLK